MTTKPTNKKDKGTGNLISEPRSLDILCGKTKECTVHLGTRRFRLLIDSYKDSYAKTLTKFDKMSVTLTIYEILTNASSRFLKWNKTHSCWEELSVAAARDKVGHALRFANRPTNKPSEVNTFPQHQHQPSTLPTMNASQVMGLNQALAIDCHQQCLQQQSISHSPPPPPFGTLPLGTTTHQQTPVASAPVPPPLPSLTATTPVHSISSSTSSSDLESQAQDLGSLIDIATTMKLATDTISLLNSINDPTTTTTAKTSG